MKCLTVHQPWAWAITAGHKRVENRTWATNHRGPIIIHAGRSRNSLPAGRRYIERLGIEIPEDRDLAFGAIVAVARLVRCVGLSQVEGQPFAEGPYCWVLENVRPVVPVPYSGKQGLFNIPDHVVQEL